MGLGSTYGTLKTAITQRLSNRPGLSAVAVGYEAPRFREDVMHSTGSGESIYLDQAEGSYQNVVMGAPGLWLEEVYSVALVIQVLTVDSDKGQAFADLRVDELLWEVLDEMSADPTFGITTDDDRFVYVQVTRGDFTRFTGQLSPSGNGARVELALDVEARIRFDPTV